MAASPSASGLTGVVDLAVQQQPRFGFRQWARVFMPPKPGFHHRQGEIFTLDRPIDRGTDLRADSVDLRPKALLVLQIVE